MKKLLALFTALMLLCGTCLAEAPDYTAMSDAELHAIIDAARNELAKRERTMAADTVLIEQNDVTVYLTGKYRLWDGDDFMSGDPFCYLDLEVVVVNDSDRNVSVTIDTASVNGWVVYGSGISETTPGKKQKGELEFKISDGEAFSYEEVEEIEINFYLYDMDQWERIADVDPVIIQFPISAE